jgi:hypothetical protein
MNILNNSDQLNITSDLNFNNNKGINLANPSNTQDIATKAYVDAGISNIDNTKLSLTGGILSGLLNFGGLSITNSSTINQELNTTSTPTFNGLISNGIINNNANQIRTTAVPLQTNDVTNKTYVDTKLSLSGGTMTGNITSLRTNDTKILLGSGVVTTGPGLGDVLIGQNAGGTGGGNSSISIGLSAGNNAAIGSNSIQIGSNAGNLGTLNSSICIGQNSQAQGQDSVSIGNTSSASTGSSIAIGNTASVTGGLASICLGVNTSANSNGLAIGREAKVLNSETIIINSNAGTLLQSSANNQIRMRAGTTALDYDATGMSIPVNVSSTSTTTGSLKITGGCGISQNVNIGGVLNQPLSWCELWWAFNQLVPNTLVTTVSVISTPGIQPVLHNGTAPVFSGANFTQTSPGANRFALQYTGTTRRAHIVVTGNYATTSGTTVVFFQAITRNGVLLNGSINSWWQSSTNQIFTATSQKTLLLATNDIIEVVTGVDPLVVPAFPRTTLARDITITITTLINNA